MLKKKQCPDKHGKLECEACGLDFTVRYDVLSKNFIECYHEIPLFTRKENAKTKLSDLRLTGSNCHKMIHYKKPWLAKSDLKKLLWKNPGSVCLKSHLQAC